MHEPCSTDDVQLSFDFERWQDIPGWEGLYCASTLGRIRSIDRIDSLGRKRFGQILRPKTTRKGYLEVHLLLGSRHEMRTVHRLVLDTFVGPRPDGLQCRHLDGNPQNNQLSNLAWGTSKANHADQVAHGTQLRGETATGAKLTERQVLAIRSEAAAGASIRHLSERYGRPVNTIRHVVSRYSWRHV